jgi:hypothetical protein
MSQRTALGAQVDGMLKAYARTLQKTMEQARTMDQVVDEPAVRILADTPDKAVVWAIALGLRDEVAAVLTRTLEDRRAGMSTAQSAFYPLWFGATAATSGFGDVDGMRARTVSDGGGLFSGSAVPDFNGMFSALDSIGTTPASKAAPDRAAGASVEGAAPAEAAPAAASELRARVRPMQRRDRRPGGGERRFDRPRDPDRRFPDRPPRTDRPPRDADRAPGSFGPPPRYGQQRPSYPPRPSEDAGMSIRLDPRRVGILKRLAAEEGVRPGELAVRWLEERLDAVRVGAPSSAPAAASNAALAELSSRLDELSRRVDRLAAAAAAPAAASAPSPPAPTAAASPRPGRPKPKRTRGAKTAGGARPPLHEEIRAVLSERGPQTASELASAIVERGRYQPPRSGKAIDAAMINGRVSNPTYRGRFTRSGGRIGLAEG